MIPVASEATSAALLCIATVLKDDGRDGVSIRIEAVSVEVDNLLAFSGNYRATSSSKICMDPLTGSSYLGDLGD